MNIDNYSLVITDFRMEGKNGIEFAREMNCLENIQQASIEKMSTKRSVDIKTTAGRRIF